MSHRPSTRRCKVLFLVLGFIVSLPDSAKAADILLKSDTDFAAASTFVESLVTEAFQADAPIPLLSCTDAIRSLQNQPANRDCKTKGDPIDSYYVSGEKFCWTNRVYCTLQGFGELDTGIICETCNE